MMPLEASERNFALGEPVLSRVWIVSALSAAAADAAVAIAALPEADILSGLGACWRKWRHERFVVLSGGGASSWDTDEPMSGGDGERKTKRGRSKERVEKKKFK